MLVTLKDSSFAVEEISYIRSGPRKDVSGRMAGWAVWVMLRGVQNPIRLDCDSEEDAKDVHEAIRNYCEMAEEKERAVTKAIEEIRHWMGTQELRQLDMAKTIDQLNKRTLDVKKKSDSIRSDLKDIDDSLKNIDTTRPFKVLPAIDPAKVPKDCPRKLNEVSELQPT